MTDAHDDATAETPRPEAVEQADGITPDARAQVEAQPAEPELLLEEIVTRQQVTVRRTPRYARFMILGAAICAVAAFVVTYATPNDADYSKRVVFGFMLILGIIVGLGLGAVAALLAELATRRGTTATAERTETREASQGEPR